MSCCGRCRNGSTREIGPRSWKKFRDGDLVAAESTSGNRGCEIEAGGARFVAEEGAAVEIGGGVPGDAAQGFKDLYLQGEGAA
jgi:hypothetical protein